METEKIRFRCSALGNIMTDARSKSETISETAKAHCVDVFISEKYGRKKDISNKFITKGLMVEEDSITLFSRHTKTFFKKNEVQLKNHSITGTPDLFEGEQILSATKIIDVKSSWDIYTFFRSRHDKLNSQYFWQLQGYMALTGAQSATLAYCLINTPEMLIDDEKRKLQWKTGTIDDEQPEFKVACAEMDKLMRYDDIPMEERITMIDIPRDETAICRIYQRVADCRKWIAENLFSKNY